MLQHSHQPSEAVPAPYPTLRNIPVPFQRLMKQLDGRTDNLRLKDAERAAGIMQNIRHYDRATESQVKEITRLHKLSERKQREPKKHEPRWHFEPYPEETAEQTYRRRVREISNQRWRHDGTDSAADQRSRFTRRAEADYRISQIGPEAYAIECREADERRKAALAKRERNTASANLRHKIIHYDRAHDLPFALPFIDLPHRIERPRLLKMLRHRRDWLLSKPRGVALIDINLLLPPVRSCLGAELLAHYRDLAQAKMLQEAV